MNNQTLAIIVAGGRGSRISGDQSKHNATQPKQYQMLGTSSILDLCVGNFTSHPSIDHVLVVIHPDDEQIYHQLVQKHAKLLPPVFGGNTRQQSVCHGLIAAKDLGHDGKILIHDAARPFVDCKTITKIIENIHPGTCALPAHRAIDTLKHTNKNLEVIQTINRDNVFCAQTPQGFMAGEITQIHERAAKSKTRPNDAVAFSDDAAMFEAAGLTVKIVEAPSSNFKITTGEDLVRARQVVGELAKKKIVLHADIRTGNGYDVHAFGPGDGIILCGYKIPFDRKLIGHSDADVALHALTDAMLGTIGAGDIGSHFPPSDSRWKGAASHQFLTTALHLIKNEGGQINNVDLTIICEEPKIGPHREKMRQNLARLCDLELARVSIKATTNEKLGFLGRAEGVAAIATTTASFGMKS